MKAAGILYKTPEHWKEYQEYSPKKKEQFLKWVDKHRSSYNSYQRDKQNESAKNLDDAYIRKQLRNAGIKNEDITEEMIANKRKLIQEKRAKKNKEPL